MVKAKGGERKTPRSRGAQGTTSKPIEKSKSRVTPIGKKNPTTSATKKTRRAQDNTNVFVGGALGGVVGAMVGGPIGAIVGGLIGLAAGDSTKGRR